MSIMCRCETVNVSVLSSLCCCSHSRSRARAPEASQRRRGDCFVRQSAAPERHDAWPAPPRHRPQVALSPRLRALVPMRNARPFDNLR
eukprot:4254721-Prymnesium_polylepis.1